MDLGDPPGEGPQALDVGRDDELVEVLTLIGEQADVNLLSTEIESSATCEAGLLGVPRFVDTTERVTNGVPSSSQSEELSRPKAPSHVPGLDD